MGNLLPMLVFLPFAASGVLLMYLRAEIFGLGFYLLVAGVVLGWLGVNFFGLFGNAALKRKMAVLVLTDRKNFEGPRHFVGLATPSYSSLLDAHEDVGYLLLYEDRIEFVGEKLRIGLPRTLITNVRFRSNIHSILGLGRWVSVDGIVGEKPVRLLVEPREHHTLLKNKAYSRKLLEEIKAWAGSKGR
jgi:hypothetical protein